MITLLIGSICGPAWLNHFEKCVSCSESLLPSSVHIRKWRPGGTMTEWMPRASRRNAWAREFACRGSGGTEPAGKGPR